MIALRAAGADCLPPSPARSLSFESGLDPLHGLLLLHQHHVETARRRRRQAQQVMLRRKNDVPLFGRADAAAGPAKGAVAAVAHFHEHQGAVPLAQHQVDLAAAARAGGHHSGNWGGLLRNPGVRLANAIACLIDRKGRILVPSLLPASLPASVRNALRDVKVGGGPDAPPVDAHWGEPGMTPAERVFGWNTLEVLAFKTGNPEAPVNAIPGHAWAHCQIRFVVGSDEQNFIANLRAHLDAHAYADVEVTLSGVQFSATRLNP